MDLTTLLCVLVILIGLFLILCGWVLIQLLPLIRMKTRTSHLLVANTAQHEADKFIHEMVKVAVVNTNKSFVDPLKAKGEFEEKHHIIAFSQTKQFIMRNTNPIMFEYYKSSIKNMDTWLDHLIEYTVYETKLQH